MSQTAQRIGQTGRQQAKGRRRTDAVIAVRRATIDDVPALVRFNVALARETEHRELSPPNVGAGVKALFNRPAYGFYLVAEVGTTTVGGLMITFEWSDWRNGVYWWVQSVYVEPAYRRRGVYRALYAKVRDLAAADRTVCGFRLYVEKNNAVAQTTYRRLGMAETPYRLFEEQFRSNEELTRP